MTYAEVIVCSNVGYHRESLGRGVFYAYYRDRGDRAWKDELIPSNGATAVGLSIYGEDFQ